MSGAAEFPSWLEHDAEETVVLASNGSSAHLLNNLMFPSCDLYVCAMAYDELPLFRWFAIGSNPRAVDPRLADSCYYVTRYRA